MLYTNSYTPAPISLPLPDDELLGPEPYDLNWILPLHLETLENERVKLVPFIPREHGAPFFAETTKDPHFFRYYFSIWRDLRDWLTWLERDGRRNPANVYFAIIDKTRPNTAHPHWGGSLAGAIGLFYVNAVHLTGEVSFVAVLPQFQRTHVARTAVGLVLRFALELPTAHPPGLGLRRVQWRAHEQNVPSVRLAERMGFKREGCVRWVWALNEERAEDGVRPREGDKWPERFGRHMVLLSVCCDDWENGGREVVQEQMDRAV
ncbi:GNAT family N-acetyltransferase [Phanerochaete sordida]|uniref:GNAT family N-acetyltransferase n=1 Tax=Phanerochaete sordida TaxID=48140 RepID=A0A9P3LCX8_9APHY|nr:GNAT family N-acetyltransferase [Phanerochaete sordida]